MAQGNGNSDMQKVVRLLRELESQNSNEHHDQGMQRGISHNHSCQHTITMTLKKAIG